MLSRVEEAYMPFPEVQRYIYEKNPLEQVICQVRFPPILRIAEEVPAEFQERIRRDYPLFESRSQIPASLPDEVLRVITHTGGPEWQRYVSDFSSENGNWTVSLASGFLALTTKQYTRWEVFSERLESVLNALVAEYNPAFYTRVGLRYRDIIKRSKIGLDDVSWSNLLDSQIAGELASYEVSHNLREKLTNTLVALDNDGEFVRIHHGLGRDNRDEEIVYLVDSDFFTEKRVPIEELSNLLDVFNRYGRNLFRWCIKDKLHEAMEPHPLDSQ